ncbi:MAG: TIGR03618 family F420-dependent PPOX class oxidoreductase [Deltaproteobacteria bacterium]|nr:TIGR03618 family F420-dependent PPOX class oxidoreductase [Deltaproteobacteria bacterium]
MTASHSLIACPRKQVRSSTLLLFLCVASLLSVASYASAVEPKPAQRVRHGGIKPFTTEQINDFLSECRNATIATLNKNGAPQLTPVVFYWDGSTFYASVTKETIKYKNLTRDPRMSLVVDDVLGHHCVIATGKATIQEQDIWEMTKKIMYKYYGPEEGAPYVEELKKQNRVLLVLKPTKMQAWGSVPREPAKP